MSAERSRPAEADHQAAMSDGKSLDVKVPCAADVPGLTREQFTQWHNWLADSYDLPRSRLGFAVFVTCRNGTVRRRLYLSVESAFRAVERAEKRGVEAHAVLVELRQVGEIR